MSWDKFFAAAAVVGAVVAGLGGMPLAAAAQSVVVRSTGPSAAQLPPGKRLPANAAVTLRSGDHVTVLDRSGTRVLNGPGAFTLDASVVRDQTAATRVAGLLTRGAAPRTRTGAVRGAPDAAPAGPRRPESVWYIDSTRGGTWSTTPYNHYSLLASLEDLYRLPYLGNAATPALNRFGLDVFNAGV